MPLSEERVQFEAALKAIIESMGNMGSVGDGTITSPTLAGVINFVKAKLDELIPEGTTFSLSSGPNVSDPLNLLIASHLDECTKDICLSAPLTVLTPTVHSGTAIPFFSGSTAGYIQLPTNFLRLSSFRMSEWQRDVTIGVSPESREGKRQGNEFLRGGISKPVAVISWMVISTALKRVLEYYSVESAHTISKLLYIPEQTAETFITSNPQLTDALAWATAGKILQITRMIPEAKMAQERVSQAYNNL